MKKLNLGCGSFYKEGYVNVDFYNTAKTDVIHDLNKFPYPFAENEFEFVEANHVLEHLENPFAVVKEIYRITKAGSNIIIRVPHFSRGFTHADHKRSFDVTFPYYFNPAFIGGYQGIWLKKKSMKMTWFAQPYLKKTVLSPPIYYLAKLMGFFIDSLANISPFLCSRIWCFWVGGFEEIEYHFEVVK